VGTTGSGDSTVAGFLAAIINGLSSMDSITFTLGVGVSNVETQNALSGVRSGMKHGKEFTPVGKENQV
jgi:fructose-1-phosphate kinase PfkB-like protein